MYLTYKISKQLFIKGLIGQLIKRIEELSFVQVVDQSEESAIEIVLHIHTFNELTSDEILNLGVFIGETDVMLCNNLL